MRHNENFSKLIQDKINQINLFLKSNNYSPVIIQTHELLTYFEGDAPSGDVTTIDMVLQSKWLLVHELVELSELKKQGFTISSTILHTHPEEVFQAHLSATEWELALAFKEGDYIWIQKRLIDVQNWLDDPYLHSELYDRCLKLLQKYNH